MEGLQTQLTFRNHTPYPNCDLEEGIKVAEADEEKDVRFLVQVAFQPVSIFGGVGISLF